MTLPEARPTSMIPDRPRGRSRIRTPLLNAVGYADMQVVGSDVVFDADRKGYVITNFFTVDEGSATASGDVSVDSRFPACPMERIAQRVCDRHPGYLRFHRSGADARRHEHWPLRQRGYAFAQVALSVSVMKRKAGRSHYCVEEGPRVYIERMIKIIRAIRAARTTSMRRELDSW